MLKNFLQKYHISEEDILIIACSWGPDSIYLLSECMKIHPKNWLIVAHFNHSLRGYESDGDEEFIRGFCEKHNLVFTSIKKDIADIASEMKKGIEETARIERYAFLESVRELYSAKSIFVAHHLDDSIETLMFNLIRGTKIPGLMGIGEQNGHILRPLLSVAKKDILSQLHKENILYRIDSTNGDAVYLRNHLRLNIISEFERINPEYRKNLSALMQYMSELHYFIDSQVFVFLEWKLSFGTENFQVLSPFLQREVIRYLYQQANSGTIGLSEWGIAEIIRFIWDKGNYTRKELGKLYLEKKNFRVYFGSST